MNRSVRLWQIIGFVFTGVAGVLLHFIYEWTNESVIAALFSAVNESIWEHMKLLFFPLFVFSIVEYKFTGKNYENYWCVKLLGTAVGLLLIPSLYYTYTGALGVKADWFNILIFFLAAGAVYFTEYQLQKNGIGYCGKPLAAFAVLCLTGLAFVVLTFVQPKVPLFVDPVTGLYGM